MKFRLAVACVLSCLALSAVPLVPEGYKTLSDEEKTITITTKPMSGGQEINHVLRLTDFPNRPNRATRLKMTVYFTSAACCTVEVEDEGFGGFYRPSGKRWKRNIYFQTAKER